MTTSSTLGQPRTVLGPLTTSFTPPASCGYVAIPTFWDGWRGYQGQSCKSKSPHGLVRAVVYPMVSTTPVDATQCWPPTTAAVPYPSVPFGRWGFYSPGLVCPSGYTGACTATASGNAQWPVQYEMVEGETAVGCCPTGLTCFFNAEASAGSCSRITTSTVVTVATCNGEDIMLESPVITYPYVTAVTNDGIASTKTIDSVTVWAPMIQINWQSTDLGTASTSETFHTAASQSASADNNSSPTGISTGAIAGITVGYVIAVIAMGVSFAFLIRRRRQNGKAEGLQNTRGADQATKYDQQQQGQQHLYQTGTSELDGHTKPSELPGTRIVAEM